MYGIAIWNDLQQDFIQYRENGKRVTFATEGEALDVAVRVREKSGQQTKVEFIRNRFANKRTPNGKSGRVRRFRAVNFDGEYLKVVAVFNNKGDRIKE
jgi:hypothetical protein